MSTRPLHPLRTSILLVGLAAIVASLGADLAQAATKSKAASSPSAQYQRDRLVCSRIRDQDERNNCLSEASTAFASTQPTPANDDPGRYARNALLRCEALREPDAGDCRARIKGQGTTSGSVAAGGIYRELVTVEVGQVPAPSK